MPVESSNNGIEGEMGYITAVRIDFLFLFVSTTQGLDIYRSL